MNPQERALAICKVLCKYDITGPQLTVLTLIPENNAHQISEKTGENPANIYAAIRSLMKRGFVVQGKDPENARCRVTQITKDKGEELIQEIVKALA